MINLESPFEGKTLPEIEAWFLEKQAICASGRCRKPLVGGHFKMYRHDGGIQVSLFYKIPPNDFTIKNVHYGSINRHLKNIYKMWVYYHCPDCSYQSAWHRLLRYLPKKAKTQKIHEHLGPTITEVKEEDMVVVDYWDKKPIVWLKGSSFFFYDGWGLGAYVYSKEKAFKAVKFYHENWQVLTQDEADIFELMIYRNKNPFAEQKLMSPMIHKCLEKGRVLSSDVIPQVISAQTYPGFTDRFPVPFLAYLDTLSVKLGLKTKDE